MLATARMPTRTQKNSLLLETPEDDAQTPVAPLLENEQHYRG